MNQVNSNNGVLPPIKAAVPKSSANIESSDIPFNQPYNPIQNKSNNIKLKSNKVGVINDGPPIR